MLTTKIFQFGVIGLCLLSFTSVGYSAKITGKQPSASSKIVSSKEQPLSSMGEQIKISDLIHFSTDQDIILPESKAVLIAVADAIKARPQWKKIIVEGHVCSRASDTYNLDLSQRRADSMVKFLTEQGVNKLQLEAKGFGCSKPIADVTTEEGMALNRRIEFIILK